MSAALFRGGCIAAALFKNMPRFDREACTAGIHLAAPWDKVAHFFYYSTMAFLLAHGVGRRWFLLPLLLVPALGALDEWHQLGIPGREASFFDWLADELGTVVAVYVYYRVTVLR